MHPVTKEFNTREELEKAYHRGQLNRGEFYRVKSIDATYSLSVIRKGLVEIKNK